MTQAFATRLKELRASGCSYAEMASQLSREFGACLTRSAIAGCVNRLNLPKKPRAPSQPRKRKSANRPYFFGQPRPVTPKPAPAPPPRRDYAAEDAAIPLEQRRTLMTLTSTSCRWVIGDPRKPFEPIYCGAETVAGASWCRCHQARAWVGGARCS